MDDQLSALDRKPWIAPLEIGPHVGAATTAALTDEAGLNIRQPYLVGPVVGVQGNVTAAMAIDPHAANAHATHFAESDLERSAVCVRRRVASWARHAAIKAASQVPRKALPFIPEVLSRMTA